MGLDYGFILINRKEQAKSLLNTIANHVRLSNRESLQATDTLDHPNPVARISDGCLTFLFDRDKALLDYPSKVFLNDQPNEKRVAVGCVWCSLRIGARFTLFEATAATSEMSRLFRASQSIRSTFEQIARNSGALVLLFDDESELDYELLWPRKSRISRPGSDLPLDENDARCAQLLQSAGVANVKS